MVVRFQRQLKYIISMHAEKGVELICTYTHSVGFFYFSFSSFKCPFLSHTLLEKNGQTHLQDARSSTKTPTE